MKNDEGQPRPKYIFNNSINVELTSTFFTPQRFGLSPSLNFKYTLDTGHYGCLTLGTRH